MHAMCLLLGSINYTIIMRIWELRSVGKIWLENSNEINRLEGLCESGRTLFKLILNKQLQE
jgi:hypothetical protein